MATRSLQSKWVVLIGLLAVVGMTAAPALAGHHQSHGFRGDLDRHHVVPYYGYSQPYYSAPYPYYCPQVVYPPYYYGGGYGYGYARPGWDFHVRIR